MHSISNISCTYGISSGFADLVNVSRNIASFYFWTTNIMKFTHKNFYLHTTKINVLTKKIQRGDHNLHDSDPPFGHAAKTAQNDQNWPDFHWSHRALGMSVFDVRHGVKKEIVHTSRFWIDNSATRYVHTCGTQKAHRWFWENSYQNAVPGVCLMCAYNVPDVCRYLGVRTILKYNIIAFQLRVARLYTTKTRCCSSI